MAPSPGFVHILGEEKYELSHILVALLYGVFFLAVLFFLLFRGHFGSRPFFNCFLLSGVLLRGCWLVFQAFVQSGRVSMRHWHDLYFVLNTLPTFLFFVCFFIVLSLWILVYGRIRQPFSVTSSSSLSPRRQSLLRRGQTSRAAAAPASPGGGGGGGGPAAGTSSLAISQSPHRVRFFLVNLVMFVALFSLYGVDYWQRDGRSFEDGTALTWAERATMALEAAIYLATAAGFAVYGLLFRAELRRMQTTAVRRRILAKVQRLTLLTVVCFSCRAGFVVWAMSDPACIACYWFFDFLYFGLLELLPLTLLIAILHQNLGAEHRSVVIPSIPSSSPSVQYQ